jgi:hypothetical protein
VQEDIPELLRDKNVKIIKHTKNEVLAKLTQKQSKNKDDDENGSDSDFERSSNDELNTADNLLNKETRNNYEQVDKDGVKWTILNDNLESSWNQFKKFERWTVIDAIKP